MRVFSKGMRVFSKCMRVFSKCMRVFSKRLWVFSKRLRVFSKRLRVFSKCMRVISTVRLHEAWHGACATLPSVSSSIIRTGQRHIMLRYRYNALSSLHPRPHFLLRACEGGYADCKWMDSPNPWLYSHSNVDPMQRATVAFICIHNSCTHITPYLLRKVEEDSAPSGKQHVSWNQITSIWIAANQSWVFEAQTSAGHSSRYPM